MTSTKNKLVSLLVSFVLCISMMPTVSLADELSNASAQTKATDSQSSNVSVQESIVDSATTSSKEVSDSVSISKTVTDDNLDVDFVYIEQPAITQGEQENIVVVLANSDLDFSQATLTVQNRKTQEVLTVPISKTADTALLFSIETANLAYGAYDVISLSLPNSNSKTLAYDFSNDADNSYSFTVAPTGMVEALTGVTTSDSGIAVYSSDGNGNLVESSGIENAISDSTSSLDEEEVSALAMSAMSVNESIDATTQSALVVALDPGHGGSDPGASGNGLQEKDVNLKIAQYCKAELETYSGVSVYMTRTGDYSVSLTDRANNAIDAGANVIVSIHCNASESSSANGAEVIVPNESSWAYQAVHIIGAELAEKILSNIVALGLTPRSIYSKDCTNGETYPDGSLADYFTVISTAHERGVPAIIVEHAFITSPSDAEYLGNEGTVAALGVADATGIAQQYSLSKMSREDATAYVTRLYTYALGRQPDSDGLNANVNAMMYGGMTASEIAQLFFNSQEFENRNLNNSERIEAAYKTLLDRFADNEGLSHWEDELNIGMSLDAVLAGITGSSEFASLCSTWKVPVGSVSLTQARDQNYSITAFAHRLYAKVLNREPDLSGLNNQCAYMLSGGSAASLCSNFFTSKEFTGRNLSNGDRVEIAYQTMLNRASDSAGKADWTEKLDAGMSMKAIVAGFAESSEFRSLCSKWGVTTGTGSVSLNESRDQNYAITSFVHRLYAKVLDREPDIKGLNDQCAYVLSGGSATALALAFFISPEFSDRGLSNSDIVEIAYQAMLDRASDASGKIDWVSKLDAGMPIGYLVAGFSNSNEFRKLCKKHGITVGSIPYNIAEIAKYGHSIMGTSSSSTISKMVSYFEDSGNNYPSSTYSSKGAASIEQFCQIVYQEASAEGVRCEVVFCQAMKETGWLQFGGQVKASQCNFCGLKTSDGSGFNTFSNVRTGIRAHVQHLKLYASTDDLVNTCVDSRWNAAVSSYGRGSAPLIENLSGKWAAGAGSDTYGSSIYEMTVKLLAI